MQEYNEEDVYKLMPNKPTNIGDTSLSKIKIQNDSISGKGISEWDKIILDN